MAENETVALRVTQASLNQTALDWARNITNIYAAVDEAVAQGSDILALEELTLTGYDVADDFARTDNTRILAALDDIAAYANALNPNLIISIGHPWRVQKRDLPGPDSADFERSKDPLYDRLNKPFNVQTILSGGSIVAMNAKTNNYNDGRGYEDRNFNQHNHAAVNRIGGTFGTIPLEIDEGRTVPFGSPVIYVVDRNGKGFYLGQAICETKWVATKYDGYPYDDSRYDRDNMLPSYSRYMGGKEGTLLLIANASPPARDKMDKHTHLNKLAARYFGAVVDTDGLGSSGSTFAQFGHREVIKDNNILGFGARMSFGRVATTTTTFEIDALPAERIGRQHVNLSHIFSDWAEVDEPKLAWRNNPLAGWDIPENPDRHFEEIIRDTALWLFDYMRKTNGKGVMEALSGGADSAFNSLLVSVMANMGMKELGIEGFCKELRLPATVYHKIKDAADSGGIDAGVKAYLDDFLTGVYMGTDNSSENTREAARFLMEGGVDVETGAPIPGIGGKFEYRNIQELVDFFAISYAVENPGKIPEDQKLEFIKDISAYFNANPNTTTAEEREDMEKALLEKYPQIDHLVTAADGTVYENLQAWPRQAFIRLYAQKEHKIPIANPNLDEGRNGYTTFGGDEHAGNIGTNFHINKDYQLQAMRYLFKHGLQGVMPPVRALGKVLKQTPSAELMRPGANGQVVQTDEDSLQRTYPQMHKISTAQLHERIHTKDGERRLNAGEVFKSCQQDPLFDGVDENRLYNMLKMNYVRWGVAQHKIHAAPISPTFGQNVDHQVSQRTPNLSGQSRDELVLLGIDLLYKWAKRDGIDWSASDRAVLERRAWQDEDFIAQFDSLVAKGRPGLSYDLENLYKTLKTQGGWDAVFKPLDRHHPIAIISKQPALEVV